VEKPEQTAVEVPNVELKGKFASSLLSDDRWSPTGVRVLAPTFADRGMSCGQRGRPPRPLISDF
jgi:hypothetical protein